MPTLNSLLPQLCHTNTHTKPQRKRFQKLLFTSGFKRFEHGRRCMAPWVCVSIWNYSRSCFPSQTLTMLNKFWIQGRFWMNGYPPSPWLFLSKIQANPAKKIPQSGFRHHIIQVCIYCPPLDDELIKIANQSLQILLIVIGCPIVIPWSEWYFPLDLKVRIDKSLIERSFWTWRTVLNVLSVDHLVIYFHELKEYSNTRRYFSFGYSIDSQPYYCCQHGIFAEDFGAKRMRTCWWTLRGDFSFLLWKQRHPLRSNCNTYVLTQIIIRYKNNHKYKLLDLLCSLSKNIAHRINPACLHGIFKQKLTKNCHVDLWKPPIIGLDIDSRISTKHIIIGSGTDPGLSHFTVSWNQWSLFSYNTTARLEPKGILPPSQSYSIVLQGKTVYQQLKRQRQQVQQPTQCKDFFVIVNSKTRLQHDVAEKRASNNPKQLVALSHSQATRWWSKH